MKKISTFSHEWSWIKPAVIFILLLLLLIPVGFIKSLINERQNYKHTAEDSIMEPVGRQPVIEGLVVAVPYQKILETKDKNGMLIKKTKTFYIISAPEYYSLSTHIAPYYLSRGIFDVPVFTADIHLKAKFDNFALAQFDGIDETSVRYGDALLILGITSKKTFTSLPVINIDGEKIFESPANPVDASPFTNAVYYTVNMKNITAGFTVTGSISIQGGQSLSIVPMAVNNRFELTSTWPSPSFAGGWLPKSRDIKETGFAAEWEIAGLSTVFPQIWNTETNTANIFKEAERVITSFITPVNNYSQTKRCTTYAILFLAVPFLAIFLCELWSKIKIHPVQYFLIGIADALFYLLLLSLSEHFSFKISYLISAAGVCITVLLYAAAIFHAVKWGVLLSGVQAVSYLLLFGILQSEDYALLIGSIGIFCVIALLMFLTRKVDWYGKSDTNIR